MGTNDKKKSAKDIWDSLQSSLEEFSPIPFWFFNDMPDEEKIRKQLTDYVEKGVNGFVLHPRIGVPKEVPYLSEEYFKAMRFIVKTAKELSMKVVLYDEGMYPSGSAHGAVVAENPDYASKGICLVDADEVTEEGSIIERFPDGKVLWYTYTKGTIRGIHFGEDDGEPGAPASADILNPDAVDAFIRLTHDKYYEELKEHFGDTVIAFFTDEPSALGRNAAQFREWYPELLGELRGAGGETAQLRALFEGKENETTRLYHRLLKKRLREVFYGKLSVWCENHGISLMGHPEVSDDVEEELYFHIPGQDLIMRRVSPESGGLCEFDSVQAKLPADIARHLGRRRNANECFGVCVRDGISWYFTAADMKWYIDWLGIRGVNLFVPHAFYYSVDGARSEERPPDVGPNNIWWPYYRQFSGYIKRLSYLMTDSVNGAKVAVLCHNNKVPYRELAPLFEKQVEFNYLPVDLLSECRVEDGKLCIGAYRYEVVLDIPGFSVDEKIKGMVTDSVDKALDYSNVKVEGECTGLRVSTFVKDGVQMALFSNEGEEKIDTTVSLNKEGAPVLIDLWKGTAVAVRREDYGFEGIPLRLERRETKLLVFDTEGTLAEGLESEFTDTYRLTTCGMGDVTAHMGAGVRSGNTKTYTLQIGMEEVNGHESIVVNGEEMIECYVNGELTDVGFWAPYKLHIGKNLKVGENEIKLVATGNAANIYCDAEIPFGLKAE